MHDIDIRRIDLNLLVAFEAIYREGTVTRAGERLHLTQSALSHSLGRLRTLFGDALFERQGNGMAPTVRARSLIRPVQAALKILESSINQAVPSGPARIRRKLRIGMISTDEAGFLPQLIERQQEDTRYEVVITRYDEGKFETRLAAGKFDLAIQPLAPHSEHVHRTLLTREGLVVVARRGHPMVGKGALDLETYMSQRHIVVSPGNLWSDMIELAFQRLRLNREVLVRCHDYWTACQIVARSDCVLTGSSTSISRLLESFPGIRRLPMPAELELQEVDICLYWHETSENDPANQWARTNLVSIYDELRRARGRSARR